MSNSQYETYKTYETFEPYEAYGPACAHPVYGGFDAPPADLHSAETLGYGRPGAPVAHEDTYRPAYEVPPLPGLPRQGAPDDDAAAPVTGARTTRAEARAEAPAAARTGSHRRSARRRKTRYAERPGDGSMRRLLPQALVVAFLAGGTTAFVAKDKAIELNVDGKARTLHTFADDVTELLAEEGVDVGAHDVVAPGPGMELTSGDEVAVHYGRPVRLTLDGQRSEVWTTAHTVEGALRQLGVRQEGAYVSTSRSRRIGREGLALDVRTERAVTIMADGRARTVRTNAATVREAVEEAGITLRGQDTTSVPQGSFPRDGQTVTVLRITGGKEVREEPIPFQVRRTDDPTLFRGTEVVEEAGRPGLRRVTYSLRTVNGVKQKPRRIRSEVVREPRPQVVKVGTKPRPTSVQGADHLDWQGLAACESGGRPDAVDSSGTYGGLYQFDTQTWQALGGQGRPQDAPAAEQTYRAKKLYVRRGASPWPHCGGRLRG
ncbi:resuscitation-promoting factor [Streptomyces swartbergensis]|uniref:Resuscitation-promoting factor n=1 Tax=Streptomyces swartbergensis TaxID=487165 RepID=A0A243QWR3_9ACTN|nr:resuscitation-promoting factor [Streptomyces swartbergensis]OUC86629.1 resuscitation-promoting factor [Streptomyces swartbergensis]